MAFEVIILHKIAVQILLAPYKFVYLLTNNVQVKFYVVYLELLSRTFYQVIMLC